MNTDHSKNELGYRTQTCGQLEHKNLIENHIKKVSIQVKCQLLQTAASTGTDTRCHFL